MTYTFLLDELAGAEPAVRRQYREELNRMLDLPLPTGPDGELDAESEARQLEQLRAERYSSEAIAQQRRQEAWLADASYEMS